MAAPPLWSLPPSRLAIAREVALAVGIVAVATLIRLALDPLVGDRVTYVTYFPAIVAIGWWCSLPTAALGVAACVAVSTWLFVEPRGSLAVPHTVDRIQTGVFVLAATAILAVCQAGRRARAAVQATAAELAASREQLELALEASRMGTWSWDIRTGAIGWSDNLEEVQGLAKGSFDGTFAGFMATVHPDDRAMLQLALERAMAGGTYDLEFRTLRPDGLEHWMRGLGRVFAGADGKPERMVGIGIEITDRKLAQRSLEGHAADLERSNAELEHFAYVAAHDLQEPVRTIVSYLQVIERRLGPGLDGQVRDYFGFVQASALRMGEMVRAILDYSRIGREGAAASAVESAAALDAALASLDGALAASGASIERGELPRVRAVPAQLERLFLNLVGNALKFRGDRPLRVRVGATRDGTHWTFAVADNGIGIDPKHSGTLFRLFQRLHPERSAGTGIGLAACRKIVELHGGRIWFEPAPEGGTVFRFTLPAAGSASDAWQATPGRQTAK